MGDLSEERVVAGYSYDHIEIMRKPYCAILWLCTYFGAFRVFRSVASMVMAVTFIYTETYMMNI
jgi:hypothetical protein